MDHFFFFKSSNWFFRFDLLICRFFQLILNRFLRIFLHDASFIVPIHAFPVATVSFGSSPS
jgi:hypothetical protein